RDPDRVRLIAGSALDGLANPPRRIGGELRSPPPVVTLGGTNEADCALLDQVEERYASMSVRTREGHHETKIRFDHAVDRSLVSLLDPLRQHDLLGRRQ